MSPEQISDTLECGRPEQLWTVLIAYLESRAQQSDDISMSLRRDAEDALEQANAHSADAQDFHNLANAMKQAPVTFPAQADRSPKGQDREDGLDRNDESAVPEGNAPNV